MADFFLIRFSNRQEAAEQVSALQRQKEHADFKPPKDVHDFILSLVRRRPPKPSVTGGCGEIIDLAFLAYILSGKEKEGNEIITGDVEVEIFRQDDEAIQVRVSKVIKEQLESEGIEFTEIGKLQRY